VSEVPPRVVSMDDAIERLLATTPPRRSERVYVTRVAGRILAEDLVARANQPRSDVAAMDGYAVREADTVGATPDAPVTLRIVSGSYAGAPFDGHVQPGEAAVITTGASVPEGADAIVVLEATERDGDVVRLHQAGTPKDIRRAGEDLEVGVTTLPAGVHLDPVRLSLAAALGHDLVPVRVAPRVALIVTGSEVGSEGSRDGVFDSNGPLLTGLVTMGGGEVVSRDRIGDEPSALPDALNRALAERPDLIVTTGGASVGQFDLVRRSMPKVDPGFDRVLVKPGSPTLLGAWEGVPWLGLPGTPVAVAVVGGTMLQAWLHAALGRDRVSPWRNRAHAVTQRAMRGGRGKTALWLARTWVDRAGVRQCEEVGGGGASRTWSMRDANALVVLPPDVTPEAGDVVETVPFPLTAWR